MKVTKLLWKLHSLDHGIASVRYRALLPIQALAPFGYRSSVCQSLGIDQLCGVDVVIFVKAFALKDLLFAQRTYEAGIPIVLDLCDNIFVPNYTIKYPMHPAEIIQVMSRYAAVITTTGPALMGVLQKTLEVPVPIMIVSDGIEEETAGPTGRRILQHAHMKELWRMLTSTGFWIRVAPKLPTKVATRWKLLWGLLASGVSISSRGGEKRGSTSNGHMSVTAALRPEGRPSVKTLIWFGHAGGDYGQFGLSDLVDIAPSLERLARRIRIRLIVVSNNREAYQKLVQPIPIDTHYVEWDSESVRGLIKSSDVTIIPNSKDPFAVCKSANRAVLALSLGVPVVATRTPAMEVFEGCVSFDDWVEGSFRYLTEPGLVQDHLQKAQSVLRKEFGSDRIAKQWQDVLDRAKAPRVLADQRFADAPGWTVAVVIHLMQDLDLALPILTEANRWHDLRCQAWVSLSLLEASPRVWKGLRAAGVDFRVLEDQMDADTRSMGFRGVDAVLTVAETNQSPHRVPHRIATWANEAKLLTYTMQHGFENIGLTYTDDRYPIERISFASNVIFTWSHRELLHPKVPSTTRNKCIPVGCCKTVPSESITLPLSVKGERVIGIFENLHWERYDRGYAEKFVQDTQSLANNHPDIVFLVKPHHAGQWLTSRYNGTIPSAPNLVIADPVDPAWEQFTASQLINSLDGVITTPSTVALDAARAGKPVAVAGYGLDLSAYRPLSVLRSSWEWDAFLQGIRDEIGHRMLAERSKEFVERTIYQGIGSHNILQKIAGDLRANRTLAERTTHSDEERPAA